MEKSDISAQKEILEHKIKVMGKDWVQNRLEAKEQVKNMEKNLNSLSEEAHKLMVEQTQMILKGGQLSRRRKFNKM